MELLRNFLRWRRLSPLGPTQRTVIVEYDCLKDLRFQGFAIGITSTLHWRSFDDIRPFRTDRFEFFRHPHFTRYVQFFYKLGQVGVIKISAELRHRRSTW